MTTKSPRNVVNVLSRPSGVVAEQADLHQLNMDPDLCKNRNVRWAKRPRFGIRIYSGVAAVSE